MGHENDHSPWIVSTNNNKKPKSYPLWSSSKNRVYADGALRMHLEW